jgi:chemotaxis protein methyltransferase CheR
MSEFQSSNGVKVVNLQELSSDEFRAFQDFIYCHSGIRIPSTKQSLLSNRVRQRLKSGQFDGFQSYFDFLTSSRGRDELENFLDAVTTNETFFFRTETHFEWFRTDFVQEQVVRSTRGERSKQLRVWSAACSTGEEPYSLAICLMENQLRLRDWTLEIVGTDISEQALATAREGSYKERAVETVSQKQLRRYFTKVRDEPIWQVQSTLKVLVEFHQHNLMEPIKLPPFDCVFIRNVLIYFDRASKQVVVDNLINALADGGYLVVGPSEGIFDMLGALKKQSIFLYQKESTV